MSEDKKSDNGIKWYITGGILIAAAVIGAWFFSKVQINVVNDAKGFDGDSVKSVFCESDVQEKFFSDEEILELCREVRKTSEKIKLNIMIYAGRIPMSDSYVKEFADSCYDKTYGEDTDGLFYYLDMTGKKPAFDYISTSGRAVLYYEKAREDIFYELDNYLPSSSDVQMYGYERYRKDIKAAVLRFLECLEYFAENYKESSYYYKGAATGKYVFSVNGTLYVTASRPPIQKFYLMLAGLVFGVIVSLVVSYVIKAKYRFISPLSSDVYVPEDGVALEQNDMFIREYTTKHYNPPASSSGGGGGHGHSGGGTHGGGGHHR